MPNFNVIFSIRGRLTSMAVLSMNMGISIAYILGAYVDFHYIPYVCVPIPIVFAVSFIFLPNTPRYHIRKGDIQVRQTKPIYSNIGGSMVEFLKFQSAKDALKFYKGYKGNDPLEDNAIVLELDRLKMVENEQNTAERLKLADFCMYSFYMAFV